MNAGRVLRHSAQVGGLVVLVGLALAYAQRHDDSPALAMAVLAAGSVIMVVAGALVAARSARGLVLGAATRRSVPQTTLASVCAGAGVVDLIAGLFVSGWFGVVGVALVALAALSYARALRGDDGLHLPTVRAARVIADFRADHGGEVAVAVERVGAWHRLVAVASDGAYGDVVVRGEDQARAAAALAGAELLASTDSAVFGGMRTTSYEWRRMAGSQLSG